MGLFTYNGQDAGALAATAWRLSSFNVTDLAQRGWTAVTPQALSLPTWVLDDLGLYRGIGTLDAQAMVYSHADASGHVDQLAIAFAGGGTNPYGVLDSLQFLTTTYDNAFGYVIQALKTYAIDHGLSGENITFTGYSNGGGATNLLAAESTWNYGGFFSHSNFVGFEPLIVNTQSNIMNWGMENSVLFGVYGETSFPWLAPRSVDKTFATATDNVVYFDKSYADPNFPNGPWDVSNISVLSPHGEAGPDLIDRIVGSAYYANMSQDSVVVVSGLTGDDRASIWVEDPARSTSDHYGKSFFAIGTDTSDRLGDGVGSDYLDGGAGDDRFRVGQGNDHVSGGAGTDVVEVKGALADYEIYRLSDGTIYFNDKTGANGLDEFRSVESVEIGGASYGLGTAGLTQNGTVTLAYQPAVEGTSGNDSLSGGTSRDVIFALAGNDSLSGQGGDDLLHGGDGNDRLNGDLGNDQIFGDAGADTIAGGGGDDTLSGGVGSDVFMFSSGSGQDVITDFNMGAGDQDVIQFAVGEFSSAHAAHAAAVQVGDDVVIAHAGGAAIRLIHVSLAQLSDGNFLVA